MATTQSPAHSSGDDDEHELEDRHTEQAHSIPNQPIEPTSPTSDDDQDAVTLQNPVKSASMMQKRRRVTRACDECRRKKIKCDGKQPCTHCTVYSYDCTYDQPSNRRRNPAPQYIEALEIRLQRAEALLKSVCPDIDLSNLNIEAGVPQRMHRTARPDLQSLGAVHGLSSSDAPKTSRGVDIGKDSMLESMVDKVGALDLDDDGYWDFHGHSSGLVYLRHMREQFVDLMGKPEGHGTTFLKRPPRPKPMSQVLDSPKSASRSPMDANIPNTHDLPDRDCGRQLCENALDDACALMRFVHQPTFYAMFDRIYDTPPESFATEENRFLPLLYVVMALGCLFAKEGQGRLETIGYASAVDQGFGYLQASRGMLDFTDIRDLTSLQAILFMILFLQSSARLSTCYSYIGIALRSATRMGMHRSLNVRFNFVELETRRRTFWVIRKMDIYVGALLGLPIMLSDDDIDQDYPLEVDDEYITVDDIRPMPPEHFSAMAAANAHTKLVKILTKTVKFIYPIKGQDNKEGHYVVSHARIREIEQDLQSWMESLPMALRPGGEVSPDVARIQQLLRISYAHVQMFLYRPFLHYVSQTPQTKSVDKRSYACAAACVSVSRNIVHITYEMNRKGLLIGAYWFTMYTTFFAILQLVFFVLENPQSSTSHEIYRDAQQGYDVLASLARRSMTADRCTQTLAELFKQLPERLKQSRLNSVSPSTKKRRNQPLSIGSPTIQPVRSASHILSPQVDSKANATTNVQRSSTYPSQSGPWKSIPKTLVYSSRSDRPSVRDYDAEYRNSQTGFTPSNSDNMTPQSPDSIGSGAMPLSANRPTFGFTQQQIYPEQGLPDFSAMMFPSPNPFAYPNQPMNTLEDRYPKEENAPDSMDTSIFKSSPSVQAPALFDSDHEVQLLGPMAPYMMQGQQPAMQHAYMNLPVGVNRENQGTGSIAFGGELEGWPIPQQRPGEMSAVNLDEVFDGSWNADWTNEGYRH